MINRSHRFHGYTSLRRVYRSGAVVRGPLFSIRVLHNPKRKSYRLAVVVSRKVNKSAVTRNRIRRRLYEITRLMEEQIAGPYDMVITVFHDSVAETEHKELAGQMKKLLKEAGVIAAKRKL